MVTNLVMFVRSLYSCRENSYKNQCIHVRLDSRGGLGGSVGVAWGALGGIKLSIFRWF